MVAAKTGSAKTNRDFLSSVSLQARFRQAAAAFSDRIAVRVPATLVAPAWQLTYRELDAWSDDLANRLQSHGVERGSTVGLYTPRSAAAVAAVVGIAKLGAVYVPLGLDYPEDRILFTLHDTALQTVLVPEAIADRTRTWGIPVVVLENAPTLAAPAPAPLYAGVAADCAYILYTSGSTGRPKGVEVPQRGILRLVDPANEYCRFDESRRFLLLAPLTFDAATFEVWGALLNGGCCVIYPTEGLPDPLQLAAILREERITTLWLTASLFNWLIDNDALADTHVDELLAGGEALSPAHVRRAQQQMPNTQFINGYGPTETTTFACCYRIPRPLPADWQLIPIGFPLLRTPIHILDEQGKPVAVGGEGELFIGGDGVALGYRNLPEQTAARFKTLAEGDRVYATGDRVTRTAEGAVEYRGRADDQIKISGYRIELGEINHALTIHPDVNDAVTLVREIPNGQRQLVAYVATNMRELSATALREHLHATLPPYMIPSQFVLMEKLPINANGKVDRNALKQLVQETVPKAFAGDVGSLLRTLWSDALGRAAIGDDDSFFNCGGTSLIYMGMITRAQKEFGLPLRALDIFEYPVFAALARVLEGRVAGAASKARDIKSDTARDERGAIAVVGVASRVPGARDARQFWSNLVNGVESITRFAAADLDPSIPAELRDDSSYVSARGLIPEAEYFDAAFFGISPLEAGIIDPQQRIFLETAWEALEDAAIPPSDQVSIGVFAGTGANTYFLSNVLPNKGVDAGIGELPRALASEKDYVATRTAFKLGLTGPAVSVHTACSTSLVAIAQAVDSLRAGRCDVALAGGVSLNTPLNSGYLFQEGGMLSPDGSTRSFDVRANGTSFNSGAGAVVLKPLAQAQADGDRIYAVIRGVGINNDGGDKASFTAPSIRGQVEVILQAQRDAGIDPRSISYIETHGTATPLGDPIEVEALTRAFAAAGVTDKGFCAIGSVKSNFGHVVAAAGVSGLIKTALSLYHRQLPATLHYTASNPQIDFANSPFFVNAKLTSWQPTDGPLRAAVSSFGVGGTNAHVIVEQAPESQPAVLATTSAAVYPELLLLSAKKPERLQQASANLAEFFAAAPKTPWANVAWTLQKGRARFKERQWLVLDPRQTAEQLLREAPKTHSKTATFDGVQRGVVFMFPGQGSQYVAMGQGLYHRYDVYRQVADECFELLRPRLPRDLREVLFAGPDADLDAAAAVLKETQYTQPALFVTGYALARLWMSWGVEPAALIGHSIGEFVAATIAGVFSLEEGLRLVAERARLMQAQPTGAMLAVQGAAETIRPQLPSSCDIAAINGPELCVVSGPHADVEQLAQRWSQDGIQAKLLHTSHAFHSPMMDAAIEPFAAVVRGVTLHAPAIPIMSTVDVSWLSPARAQDHSYWARHLRETVRFADGVRELLKGEPALYLEVGPRNTTATLAAQQMRGGVRQPVVTSLGASPLPGDLLAEQIAVLVAAGELWQSGIELQWSALHEQRPAIVSLPTYPFARDRHWLDVSPGNVSAAMATAQSQPLSFIQPYAVAAMPESGAAPVVDAQGLIQLTSIGAPSMDQQSLLLNELRELFAESSGEDLSQTPPDMSFLELGFDSLFLTQAALSIKKRYKADIPFRRLMSDLADFGSLARALMQEADPSVLPSAVAAQPAAPIAAASVAQPAAPTAMQAQPAVVQAGGLVSVAAPISAAQLAGVQGLIQQQLLLMAQQLQMLGGAPAAFAPTAPVAVAPAAAVAVQAPVASPTVAAGPALIAATQQTEEKPPAKPFGAQTRIDTSNKDHFTPSQREHYLQLAGEYTAKTAKSKAFTTQARPRLADPRVVSGFRPAVKEITYPLVVDRSKGCRLWDLDGNEYIDTLCGYGSMFFGYQPDWIVAALNEQMARGMEIGPQHPLTREVTELLAEFLPHDRYAFCNTGSEAVLGAMRMARTATGSSKIVMFNGDYHGIVDEVIVRGGRNHKSFPAAAGIMSDSVKNMVVLEYGSDEALDYIRDNAEDIAGVLVETVQSRHPELVPVEFLKKLRALTTQKEVALIFDEVITGFRTAPGGFQEYVGIQADICAYGKVIGGGLSLGIIAGTAKYMDTLDGGAWQFGDDSTPEVGVTYFAGTFVRHPLALAAAKAVLLHLKQQGPQLQRSVNEKAAQFAADLNLHFQRVNAPMEIEQFSSMMYFKFTEDLPWGELMFCDMRRQGIHAWYGRPMFVSCAHTDEDLAQIRSAFMRSLARMQEWGFIPGSSRDDLGRELAPPIAGARLAMDESGNPAWFVEDSSAPTGLRQVSASFE